MRRLLLLLFLTSLVYTAVPAAAQRGPDRARIIREIEETDRRSAESVRDWLMEHRIPQRIPQSDGGAIELVRVDNGRPTYFTTLNSAAAHATRTDALYPGAHLGLSLTGQGIRMGIWDSGHLLDSHREINGRTTFGDNAETSDHATHVAGTLIATGIDARARGMAYQAGLISYSWTNDATEMTNEAGLGMLISNHSYSIVGGWHYGDLEGRGDQWYWLGDPTISTSEDYMFGRYDIPAVQFDRASHTNPYYLPVVAAGNDRIDTGPASGPYRAFNSNGEYVTYHVESRFIPRDGGADGFDTIAGAGVAKNVLTVGSLAFYDGSGRYQTSSFSSFGPADDGRVKPDIMGLGERIYSLASDDPNSYAVSSGTSMATPNVAGSLALLQQYHQIKFGEYMRAATLKGLVIHTADDLDMPGPDYRTGWGVLNMEAAAEHLTRAASVGMAILEESLEDGDVLARDLVVEGGDPLRITLSWTDPPGTRLPLNSSSLDNPAPQLQNDLDLRLVHTETGIEYLPFVLNPMAPGAQASHGDNRVDPIEQIYIAEALPGFYRLTVSHKGRLAGGAQQDFSVLITGAGGDAAPVAVAHVSAEADLDGVTLRWNTLFERGEGHFEVERGIIQPQKSRDDEFEVVGMQALAGDGGREYEFIDTWSIAGHYRYRIVLVDGEDRYLAAQTEVTIVPPDAYAILSNYPNPFRDQVVLVVDIPRTQLVKVTIFDAIGREVSRNPEVELRAGRHLLPIDGADWPAGVYFARVETPNGVSTQQLVKH